jgi:hypothetical protein
MNIEEVYEDVIEEILPYLSDPGSIREFLNSHRENSIEMVIEDINNLLVEADVPFKTDLRILLNAILKRS